MSLRFNSGTSVSPPPIADDKIVETDVSTSVAITLTGTSAVPEDRLKWSIVKPPEHGKVTSPPDTPPINITYAPQTEFTGGDSFTYKVTNKQGVDSATATVTIRVNPFVKPSLVGAHALWIIVSISLIGAIYLAYLDTTSKSTLDLFLPKTNITINIQNISSTSANTTVTKTFPKAFLSVPQIPRFVILWGYIGAAAYLLKVVTAYLGVGRYDRRYLPFHISRLFIGPALAVVTYFILQTGSFFGLSFDVTKVPIQLLPYLYAGVAFLTGYFVRSIIETLSKIINAIFNIHDSSPTKSGQLSG